jgi:hypothetical protein
MPHEPGHPWSKEWEESQYASTNNKDMPEFDSDNIDWGTVGSGSSSFGSSLADLFITKDRIARQEGYRGEAQEDIDKFYSDFEAGKYDAKMNQKMLDAFSVGRQDLDINPSLSAFTTSLASAQNDPRTMAAALPGLNTSATKGLQGLQQQNFQNELGSRMTEGQAYQGLDADNLAFTRGIYGQKLQGDQAAYGQAQQNIEALKAAKAAAPYNMLGGLFETGAGLAAGFAEDGMKIPEYQDGGDVMQQILSSQGQEGAVPPRQDLPGEEDHESNPISMVAENGEVVGEATGGEIILNGEQTEEIESAVAMVSQAVEAGGEPPMKALMALYEAVSKTLSQPQFQDGQQDSPEANPAKERMMMMLEGGEQMA